MLYKREVINSSETIGYSLYIMMSIVIGSKWPFYSCIWILMLLGQVMYRLCTKGRAPRTKETLPDFREKCRVTRHSRVFPRVDG